MRLPSFWKKTFLGLLILFALVTAAAWWGYSHLTAMVQARLREVVGNDLTIGRVRARWNRVELEQVRLARHGAGAFDRRVAVGRIVLRPRLVSLINRNLDLGEIILENPYLLLEIMPDGSLARFFPPTPPQRKENEQKGTSALPISIASVHISGGIVEILDWNAARRGGVGLSNPRERYHLLHLQDVSLDTGRLDIPLIDYATTLHLSMKNRGGGDLSLKGALSPKSMDSGLKLDIGGLNITSFRPYFLKKGDLGVSAGTLAAVCDISIQKRILKAPGTIILNGLEFDQSGTKGALLGIPAWAMVKFMSDSKEKLKVNFEVSGSLDNPRFTIRQSLIDQIATALSSKLGVSTVGSVGKGIVEIGGKGLKWMMGIFGGK
jgi:hypothetical protein